MAVHLTRIYTRTGDDGTTALGDLTRIRKDDVRLVAYADTDEANAAIGVALALESRDEAAGRVLRQVQNDLFDVGADLAVPITAETQQRLRVTQAYVDRLEADCDRFNEDLEPLDSFVLPGGTPAAAALHLARTVCRRAERHVVELMQKPDEKVSPETVRYLNRLSDFLFVASRAVNDGGARDVLWVPGQNR
jgi:cob(I)alamin adenosyltransferase